MAALIATWIDGVQVDASVPLEAQSRFADGLFETVPLWRGEPLFRAEHRARLRLGLRALKLARLDFDQAIVCAMDVRCPERAVLRLSVHARAGAGYQRLSGAPPILRVSLSDWPHDPWRDVAGLTLRWCRLRLSEQPALAGVKHLNRLEQVLARAEWTDPTIHEGLLCDSRGTVIEGVCSNLFMVIGAQLLTPKLDRCGVAGCLRARILRRLAPDAREAELTRREVLSASEVFMCNSVRGIRPVVQLGTRRLAIGQRTLALQQQLAREPGAQFYSS